MSTIPLTPKDHAEAIALFRAEIVGSLVRRELEHGDLRRAFAEASQQRFRPLFPQDTVALLHEATAGALRDLDRIAVTCLRHAARKKRKTVDRDVVATVLKNTAR